MKRGTFPIVAAVLTATTALLFLLCLMGRAGFDASRPALAALLEAAPRATGVGPTSAPVEPNIEPDLAQTDDSIFRWEEPRLAGYWDFRMLPDGQGGVYVAWSSGTGNVPNAQPPYQGRTYIQRYNSSGDRLWGSGPGLWGTEDLLLSDTGRREGVLALLDDGAGGVIVVWAVDDGFDGVYSDLRAQRLSPSGVPLWQAGGVPVVTNVPYLDYHEAVSDGQGGFLVTWSRCENPNNATRCRVWAQRIRADGTRAWAAGDVPLSFVLDNEELWIGWAQSDNQGGAYVVWEETRGGKPLALVQHVDGQGNVRWTGDAHQFPFCPYAGLQVDASRVIGLRLYHIDSLDVYRLNLETGAVEWGPVTVEPDNTYPAGRLASDGAGGVYVSWIGYSSGWVACIQRVSAQGQALWGPGVCLGRCTYCWAARIVPDGRGGAYVAWAGPPSGYYVYGLRIQHVDADGQVLWQAGGVLAAQEVSRPKLQPDGLGGAFVAWATGGPFWQGHERDYPFYLDVLDPKNIQLAGLYVDDGAYRPLANPGSDEVTWLSGLAWPLNVNKAPGDKLDVVATIFNGEPVTQSAHITVTLPSANWTLAGCYLRSHLSGQGDQPVNCSLNNGQSRVDLPNFPTSAARQVVLRFQLPSDVAPGRVTLSADLELEQGYPSLASHQEVSFNVVNSAPAIIVTNRRLLYEKYPDDQVASLLQDLASVAQGATRGTQAAVIYYADWYDDAVANWDNVAITYTNPLTVNQVADVIDSHIVTWTRRFTPTYLMIVGGDEIIPSYRVSDTHLANREKDMGYPLGRPAFNAIRSNYFFSDAPYADTRGNDWLSGELELAPGRIVGVSAQDMCALLLRGAQGLGDSVNAFVGSDTRNDVDDVVSGLKARGLTIRNDGGANDTTENNAWSKAVMTTAMKLGFRFFAHSHHGDYNELKVGTGPSFSASEVPGVNSAGAISDNRPFVSTSGCHAGLVVDADGNPQSNDNLVWAFIHEGSSAYLGSGAVVYLNGNNGQLGDGEEWFNDFYSQVVTRSHTIGEAYRLASVNFNPGDKWERRSTVQFILYGVPWMRPSVPAGGAAVTRAQTQPLGYNALGFRPVAAAANGHTRTVEFAVTDYTIVAADGYELVTIPGAEQTFHEHKPILPKLHGPTLYLPPGALITGISMTAGITTSLGTHHIPSAQPSTTVEPTGGYTDTTDVVGTYPDPIYGYDVSTFADHTEVTPFIIAVQHDHQTQETTLWQTVTLEISYQAPVAAAVAEFSTDKPDYGAGETINATATVANAGASDLTNLTAQLAVKDLFGQVQGTASSAAFNVAAGGTQEVSVPFAGALSDGTYSLELAIADAPTTLATSSRYVRVSSGQIISFSVPSEIVGWPAVTFSISYRNDSTSSQVITGTVQVYDAWGEEVASLSAEPVSVGAGQTRDVELNWDPHYEPAGDYVAVASATADSQSYGPDFGPFRIILEEIYLPVVLRSYP